MYGIIYICSMKKHPYKRFIDYLFGVIHLCEISFQILLHLSEEGGQMRTVDKSMVHINGKRKYQTAFTGYGLAGSHQRITATVACFGKCIGYRGEIHFGNRTQMDHIVIALLGKNLFGSIRVTVLGHVCYQGVGFGIETFKVFVIGNAHGIECFPRNGYRRNDVHPVVKNNPAFLVGTVTEFIDFIGQRTTAYR